MAPINLMKHDASMTECTLNINVRELEERGDLITIRVRCSGIQRIHPVESSANKAPYSWKPFLGWISRRVVQGTYHSQRERYPWIESTKCSIPQFNLSDYNSKHCWGTNPPKEDKPDNCLIRMPDWGDISSWEFFSKGSMRAQEGVSFLDST